MWVILAFLFFSGMLQVVFVLWVLGRNKKLTMLLVDYYRKVDMGEDHTPEHE